MNYLTRLLLGLGLAIPMSALAAEPPLNWAKSVYLNLGYSAADNALYLKQKNEKCTIGSVNEDGVECVNFAQVKADFPVSDAFVKVLRMDLGGNKFGFRWRTNPDPDMKQSSTLVLASDLDFHELQAGVCVEDHFAPDFTGKVFDGSGYIISNLCKTIDDQTGSSVGLFKEISNAIVKNVAFSDVQFVTSTLNPSDLGTKYYPVGALAGKIFRSSVEGVDFTNVVIQGPLAGGLAGVIEESLISGFWSFGTNNVVNVSNEIAVTDGYVGECEGCNISYTKGYKALVGGLAGVAYQTSFDNINLQVDVRNNAAVDLSSVGGLVGLYVTKGNQNNEDYKEFKITKISIKGPNKASGPAVAGGISMGGLLGEVKRIDSNNYPKSSLIIQEAKVENLKASQSIFKKTLPKATYLGGLIGNGDICNSGKLEISNSSVTDFEITEAVKKNGIYQYYIGGIAGYAGCDHVNNSSSTDLYLTLTKSKATGSINLSAKEPDIASTAEVHVSASIGGLVGAAVIAGNENAVAENEISVGITYDVKKTNAKIAEASEKVYIGGAFGTVNTYNSSAVVKGLRSSNYIKVVDDGVDSYVGGVVGKFPLISSGDSKISFKDVQVVPRNSKKSILLDYEAYGTPGYDSYASVGGLCGDCSLIGEIVQSSVKGHYNKLDGANGSFEKKAFSLGGLVGKSRASEAITVKNTYSDGNISDGFAVEKADEKAPKNKVGYLFGEIPGIQGQKESILISNFHYGVDNVAAIGDADGSGQQYARVNNAKNIAQVTYEQIAAVCGDDVNTWGSGFQCESDGDWSVSSVKIGTAAPSYALTKAVNYEGFAVKGDAWAQAGAPLTDEVKAALVPGSMLEVSYKSETGHMWIVMNESAAGWMRVGVGDYDGSGQGYIVADGSKAYIPFELIAQYCGDDISTWGSQIQCESDGAWEVYGVRVGTAAEFTAANSHVDLGANGIKGDGWAQDGIELTDEMKAALVPGSVIDISYQSDTGEIWIVMPDSEAGWKRVGVGDFDGSGQGYALFDGSHCQISYEMIAEQCGEDVSKWGGRIQFEASSPWTVNSASIGVIK